MGALVRELVYSAELTWMKKRAMNVCVFLWTFCKDLVKVKVVRSGSGEKARLLLLKTRKTHSILYCVCLRRPRVGVAEDP